MFIKHATVINAEKITLADWKRHIVASGVKDNPAAKGVTAEFDVDDQGFLYVRARAISCMEMHGPNQNGDAFPEAEIDKSYTTFNRRGVFINHQADDPSTAIGIILDAVWHKKLGFVECLMAIDKSEPIAKKIEAGIANTWSMGCMVEQCACSVCDKTARNEDEYCMHLSGFMGKEYDGKKVYSINHGLSFYELSNVSVPADPQAYTLQVLAQQKDVVLSEKLTKVADLYEKSHAEKSNETIINDVRGKLDRESRPVSEKKIFGEVRHRLNVAKAPLLVRAGAIHQRVQSALAAGSTPSEKPSIKIAETKPPMEGFTVENQLTIRYIPGDTLEDCVFLARKGNLQAMVRASELLDADTAKKIMSTEKTASKPAEMIKDESKPKADHEHKLGDEESQPGAKVKNLGGTEELKDESKPKADHEHKVGDEAAQPSDMVKKYAQALGAKNVMFKMAEDGSFLATLSNGSIVRLAGMWKTVPKTVRAAATPAPAEKAPEVKKEARIAGEPGGWAREEARGEGKKLAEKPNLAREDKSKEAAKPSGSSGSEIKKYYGGYDSKNLSQGGGEQWARKVAELSKRATALEAENQALKVENETIKRSFEAQQKSIIAEKKSVAVRQIVECMERMGSISVDDNEVFDLKDRGLDHKDAQAKAYANAIDRKKAELDALELNALYALRDNLAAVTSKTASFTPKSSPAIPIVGRDGENGEVAMGDEDRLARSWDA